MSDFGFQVLPPPLGGIQVTTSVHLVDTRLRIFKRHFKPGQRRGRDKRPLKMYRLPPITVPSRNVLYMRDQNMVVVHPAYLEQFREKLYQVEMQLGVGIRTVVYVDSDHPPLIPSTVAVCPKCGANLVIEDIDEWETETGRVTEAGFHINCSTEPDVDSDEWHSWWNWHWSMPYVDWLPITAVVYKWFDAHYRVKEGNDG